MKQDLNLLASGSAILIRKQPRGRPHKKQNMTVGHIEKSPRRLRTRISVTIKTSPETLSQYPSLTPQSPTKHANMASHLVWHLFHIQQYSSHFYRATRMMLSNMPPPLQQRRRGQVIFHLSHLLVFILFSQGHSDSKQPITTIKQLSTKKQKNTTIPKKNFGKVLPETQFVSFLVPLQEGV